MTFDLTGMKDTLKPSLHIVVIKNASLNILTVVALSLVGAATTTISQFASIDVVKSAYAFPCKGGIGEDYCRGYQNGYNDEAAFS
jgi:hypothetical protein